jgi:MFS family permease
MCDDISSTDSSVAFTKGHVRVIVASSLGTLFEWYDFSIISALAPYIAKHFYSALPSGHAFVMALFTFSAGLILRPFGAVLFGHVGDKIGRKYSFLTTIIIMGLSTFLIGLLPTYGSIGLTAPILLLILRCLQGLAVGGEYGGAATYLAEHAPAGKRGFYTGFLQATAAGASLLCTLVVIFCQTILGKERFGVNLTLLNEKCMYEQPISVI